MATLRKQIRHALRQLLLEAPTAAASYGTRVETNRASRVWGKTLPAVVIYSTDDPAETSSGGAAKTYDRQARIAVELWTSKIDAEEEDDRLDDLIEEVEAILVPQLPTIVRDAGGNIDQSGYEGAQMGFDASGERILAGAVLTFVFHYYLEPNYTPLGGLAPFTLGNVKYDLVGGDPIDAEQDIPLAQ